MAEISIVIPCYNCETSLAKCLDSVRAQTFGDWEALVVNDGSSDGSAEILRRLASRDSRIKILTQGNEGQAIARNRALAQASGTYVCFLDADDFCDAAFLADLHSEAKRSDADIVMTTTRRIKANEVVQTHFDRAVLTRFSDKIKALPHGGVWDKIYKADLIRKHQITFPAHLYYEDNLFLVKALFHADRFAVINGAGYNYVTNPNSTLHNPTLEDKRTKDGIAIFEMIMDFASERSCPEEDRRALSDFCVKNFIDVKKMAEEDFRRVKDLLCPTPFLEKRLKRRARRIFKRRILRFFGLRGILRFLGE